MEDFAAMCKMINGDLKGEWIHWCHDPVTNRPCCSSQVVAAEKTLIAVVNGLLGRADPLPCESRWTHTLSVFKRTLLRRLTYAIGITCFSIDSKEPVQDIKVDGEAMQSFASVVKTTRIKKTLQYYAKGEHFFQLAVLTAIVESFDSNLLCP